MKKIHTHRLTNNSIPINESNIKSENALSGYRGINSEEKIRNAGKWNQREMLFFSIHLVTEFLYQSIRSEET